MYRPAYSLLLHRTLPGIHDTRLKVLDASTHQFRHGVEICPVMMPHAIGLHLREHCKSSYIAMAPSGLD